MAGISGFSLFLSSKIFAFVLFNWDRNSSECGPWAFHLVIIQWLKPIHCAVQEWIPLDGKRYLLSLQNVRLDTCITSFNFCFIISMFTFKFNKFVSHWILQYLKWLKGFSHFLKLVTPDSPFLNVRFLADPGQGISLQRLETLDSLRNFRLDRSDAIVFLNLKACCIHTLDYCWDLLINYFIHTSILTSLTLA